MMHLKDSYKGYVVQRTSCFETAFVLSWPVVTNLFKALPVKYSNIKFQDVSSCSLLNPHPSNL